MGLGCTHMKLMFTAICNGAIDTAGGCDETKNNIYISDFSRFLNFIFSKSRH